MAKAKKSTKSSSVKITVNCAIPVADDFLNVGEFSNYLQERIKVNGKAGNLGDSVTLSRDEKNVHITAKLPFAKRYVKYLTKKFLKKHQLRDYIRVLSDKKNSYVLKYFDIHKDEEDNE